MTRAMIIGNAGGGKSTVCKAVCAAHGLPYHAIDGIQWKPDWVPAPASEYDEKHRRLISGKNRRHFPQDHDGHFSRPLPQRLRFRPIPSQRGRATGIALT